MGSKTIDVTVFRFDAKTPESQKYDTYPVPWQPGMSAMDALDYIYHHLDGSISYYDHAACALGICGKCTGRINGKPGLFCQTEVVGNVVLEPLKPENVIKDLVVISKNPKEEAMTTDERADAIPDINSVPLLVRREIEALIAAPLIDEFQQSFGKERVVSLVQKVVSELGRESGRLLAAFVGGNELKDLRKGLPLFAQGGALELDIIDASDTVIAVNITRCKYAEMYQNNNLEELGFLLSCSRDYGLIAGFNPDIKFSRTQTIMEGAAYCDFRFSGKSR